MRRPPRGVRKEDWSRRDYFDVWLPDLAPSAPAVGWALAEPWTDERWARYRAPVPAARWPSRLRPGCIAVLALLSQSTDFAVGCYCEDAAHCHRSLLRDLLLEAGAVIHPTTRGCHAPPTGARTSEPARPQQREHRRRPAAAPRRAATASALTSVSLLLHHELGVERLVDLAQVGGRARRRSTAPA